MRLSFSVLNRGVIALLAVVVLAPLAHAGIPPTKWKEGGTAIAVAPPNVDCQDGIVCAKNGNTVEIDVTGAGVDHGALTGLADDDHTQYVLSAGRSGGQSVTGGTGAGDDFTIITTSHATKGSVIFGDATAFEFNANESLGIRNTGTIPTTVALSLEDTFEFGKTTSGGNTYALFQAFDRAASSVRRMWLETDYVFINNDSGDQKLAIGTQDGVVSFTIANTGTWHEFGPGYHQVFDRPNSTFKPLTFFTSASGTNSLYIDTNRNLIINGTAAGTSATDTIVVKSGTAPSSSPADVIQFYSADITAGNAAPHFRTENGTVIKLYQTGSYTPSNVTTDRSFDANSTTLDEIADVLGTVIADIQNTRVFG